MLPKDARKGRKPRKALQFSDADCKCPFCKTVFAYEDDTVTLETKCECEAQVVGFYRID